jgi:alpha-D-xyloside xylohydrolase
MSNEHMMSEIPKKKILWEWLKGRLRYPYLKDKVGEFLPNVYFGLTDHPLDVRGAALNTPFTLPAKLLRKKASCVLHVAFDRREGNAFTFRAGACDVYKARDMDTPHAHTYRLKPGTKFESLRLRIDLLRADAYRVRLSRLGDVPEHRTPMVAGDIEDPALDVQMEEDEQKYRLATGKLVLDVYKQDFHIDVLDEKGSLVTETGGKTRCEFPTAMDAFPLGFVKDRSCGHWFGVESFAMGPGEAVYGLGEQFGPLNKVGQTVGLWHFEGLGNTTGRTYKNVPFFMSTRGYGVFLNESRPATYWVGSKEYMRTQIAVEGDLVDYYFFYGPSFKRILYTYTELTGRAPVVPKWSFGVWMSRISYFSQKQVLEVARKIRELQFPCDVINIDTGWFEKDWRCDWKFDRTRFPDPEGMFAELRQMGFRCCLWQTPYVMDETELFKDARQKKVLARNKGPFLFVWGYPAHPIDFSNPEGVKWYQERIKGLFDLGASVMKVDFGEGVEPPMEFREYDGRQMHNLYPLLYNRAAFEITEQTYGRGVIWARSAYAGSQRYPLHWSGDNSANYENMLCSLRGGLSLGLCGFTFWSHDTGGFVGTPSDDLYLRWTQWSIFQSHMRFHGNPPRYREPWNYEEETQAIVREYLNLRYRLMPYLYTEARAAAEQGLPMMAALLVEFQSDPTVFNIEDQFLCGRHMLVAPILTRHNTREIYLPAGTWYEFWTGERLEGRQWITRTYELDKVPVFVRAGTVIPLGPVVQHTGEMAGDEYLLKIFPDDSGQAAYEIRDDGQTVSIHAALENKSLKVDITPEPARLEVELPGPIEFSRLLINGRSEEE